MNVSIQSATLSFKITCLTGRSIIPVSSERVERIARRSLFCCRGYNYGGDYRHSDWKGESSARYTFTSADFVAHKQQLGTRKSGFHVYAVETDGEVQTEKDQRKVKIKISVGPVRNRQDETFTFKSVLGPSSVLVVATLRKPLGVIFESKRRRSKERVTVADLVPGSNAHRALRVNQMFQGTEHNRSTRGGCVIMNGDIRPGDVLRACTTVGVVVDLFGIRAPQRVMMLYVADGRSWDDTMAALRASFVADGPLTLIMERESLDV